MVAGISPDDPNFAEAVLNSFNTSFIRDFKINLNSFLHRQYSYYLLDRETVIIMIVTAVFGYAICGQSEDRYIQYFELVNSLREDDAEEVRMFLNNLVHDVESRNMTIDSMAKVSSSRRVIFGFENKIGEYEIKINELNAILNASNRELKRYKERNQTLVTENVKLKEEVQILTKDLSVVNEKYTESMNAIISGKEEQHTREIKELERKLEDTKIENAELKEKVEHLKQKKNVFKEENRTHKKTLSVISDNYVDKETYDKKLQEKLELEKKVMELENNYAVEISETKSLKSQLEKTKNEKKRVLEEKDREYEMKLNELRKQQQVQQDNIFHNKLNKSSVTEDPSNDLAKQRAQGWDRLTDILDNDFGNNYVTNSDFNFKTRNQSNNQMESEFIDRMEKLQTKFEELKALSSSENEGLKLKIKQMNEELLKMKQSKITESNFGTSRTISRLKSRDISSMKKNPEISEEFVQKMVDMEKKVKHLTNENKYLHQSIIKNLGAYKAQTDVLYTVIKNYIGNDSST